MASGSPQQQQNSTLCKPLLELDRLRLENLQMKAQLLNTVGERDSLRTKLECDRAILAFQKLAQEIAARDQVSEWELDLEQGCWRKNIPDDLPVMPE